jgi:hypothetical protein
MLSSETLIISGIGAVCAILAILAARITAGRDKKPSEITIGFLGPSLAAVYLLVLALSLATEWQTISDAHQAATTEAAAVRGLYWSAAGLTPGQQTFLHDHVLAYARTVVGHDWPQMRGGKLDDQSEELLIGMNSYVLHSDPRNADASDSQIQAVNQLGTLFSARSQREDDAEQRLPPGLLAGVVATSLVVGTFPFAFGVGSHRASIALAAMQAALVGIGVVVVFQLNHAYTGPLAVTPAPMQAALQQLSGS